MKNNSLLNCLFFIFLILIFITACSMPDDNTPQIEPEAKPEELEETIFLQNDFTLSIDTLPYRGAVLFIDYNGEMDISDCVFYIDVLKGDEFIQKDITAKIMNDDLIVDIKDLMYIPGDELTFNLRIWDRLGGKWNYEYPLLFEGQYPWIDWMLAEGEWFSLITPKLTPNFKYDFPNSWNNLGTHSSWDIITKPGANVYAGTIGVIIAMPPDRNDNVQIYNPYTGGVIQYGHLVLSEDLYMHKLIMPGDYLGCTESWESHIHYVVLRPFSWIKYPPYNPINYNMDDWDGTYSPVIRTDHYKIEPPDEYDCIYEPRFQRDPFYFHEPTTLGYWNEATLPPGTKDEMLRLFQKENSEIAIPATKPLDAD